MVKLGDYRFHLSTQLAGLMAKVDTENAGCPYESPSNGPEGPDEGVSHPIEHPGNRDEIIFDVGVRGITPHKALIDIDSGPDGCTEYSSLTWHKNKNNFIDENQVVCWPMVKLGDYRFHLSTQLAGLMAKGSRQAPG